MTIDRRRLVVLASGGGTNLQAVLDACATDSITADVVAVFTNVANAGALDRARSAGVIAAHLSPTSSHDRIAYDTALADAVSRHAPDYVVLAGWMRLLTSAFLDRFPGRVVNLHPALPGELPGLHSIQRAYDEFVLGTRSRSGVMVHLVPDEAVDAGPVLAAVEVPFEAGDSLSAFEARMHVAEHLLLVETLASLCAPDSVPNIHMEVTT